MKKLFNGFEYGILKDVLIIYFYYCYIICLNIILISIIFLNNRVNGRRFLFRLLYLLDIICVFLNMYNIG